MTRKTPLIALRFSNSSFLNSYVRDDKSTEPLYTVATEGPSTTVLRYNARRGTHVPVADISWPGRVPRQSASGDGQQSVCVQFNGSHWVPAESLLKAADLFRSVLAEWTLSVRLRDSWIFA
jgi:hypothetical protein